MSYIKPHNFITDNELLRSPTENAVYDALALKQDAGNYITQLTGEVTALGPGSVTATISNNAVTNAKLAQVDYGTFKGRKTSGTGNIEDLTQADATALLNTFTSTLQGLVPASGGGTSNYLRADGTWATITIPASANQYLSNLLSPTAINQVLLGLNGTALAPAYSFTSDSGTGMYRSAASTLSFTTNGSNKFQVESAGSVKLMSASGADILWNTDGGGNIGMAIGGGRPDAVYVKTNINLASLTASAFIGSDASKNLVSLTAAVATSYLNTFTDTLQGLVPPSGGGTTNFLRADGTWADVASVDAANRNLSNLQSPTAINQVLRSLDGTVTAPAYSFTNSTNTGMYSSATNTLNFSTNGISRMSIDGNGITNINTAVLGATTINGGSYSDSVICNVPMVFTSAYPGTGICWSIDNTNAPMYTCSIGRGDQNVGASMRLRRPYSIDTAGYIHVGKKINNNQAYGGTLSITIPDSIQLTYATTANNSTTITVIPPIGYSNIAFYFYVHVGDIVQLFGLPTKARVTSAFDGTSFTVDTALGDGTSRAIIFNQYALSVRKNDGTEVFAVDNNGNTNLPSLTASTILQSDASKNLVSLANGSEGQVLKIVGGVPVWATDATGMSNPMTTAGDIIVGGIAGTPTRLALGTVDKVLVSDGNTVAYQYAGLGGGAFGTGNIVLGRSKPPFAVYSTNNILIATSAGSSLTGGDNVLIGEAAAGVTSQVNNVIVGQAPSATSNSYELVGIGSRQYLSSSIAVCIGDRAKVNANQTVAIGNLAWANSLGDVVIGYNSQTGSSAGNTFIGSNVGGFSISGGNNTVFGKGSFNNASLTTAASNTIIGQGAAISLTTNNNSVIVGATANVTDTGNNNTIVGYAATASGNYGIAIGSNASVTSVFNGSIAIGRSAATTADNGIAIGQNASASSSAQISIGRSAGSVGSSSSGLFLGNYAVNRIGEGGNVCFFGGQGQNGGQLNTIYFSQGGEQSTGANLLPFVMTVTPATGTDQSAALGTFTISGAKGTGTGTGGDVIITTAPASGVSGTTRNSQVERFRVTANGIVKTSCGEQHASLHNQVGIANVITATINNYYIGVNSTLAAKTVNLPTAASAGQGFVLVIKDEGGAALTNNITIARNGADTIEGVAGNLILANNKESAYLVSDGVSNWNRI